jgi:hypothetical protein
MDEQENLNHTKWGANTLSYYPQMPRKTLYQELR